MNESMREFLIWGGGGHGKVVADLVRAAGHVLVGFIDDDESRLGSTVEPGGSRVVHTASSFRRALQQDAPDGPAISSAFAIAVGDNYARSRLLHLLAGHELPVLAHPSAQLSPSARLGEATVVLPCVVVNAAAIVGRAAILNSGAVVEHDCELEDAVHVSPNATLGGGVWVGAHAWIGAGATVLPGVRVGGGAVVGAGATILQDVPDGATVVGNPGRIIRIQTKRET